MMSQIATTKIQYKKLLARMSMKGLKICDEHYYGVDHFLLPRQR